MPLANSAPNGFPFFIKKTDSTANTVVLTTAGSDTIDGAATHSLVNQYDFVAIVGDGVSKWEIIGGIGAPLNSPIFTGNPQAPTKSIDDNSTSLATTEYADRTAIKTQAQPTRLLNTIYQNLTGKAIFVNIVIGNSGGIVSYSALTDASMTPATQVGASTFNSNTASTTVSFVVLNNNYYQLSVSGAGVTLGSWTEWS